MRAGGPYGRWGERYGDRCPVRCPVGSYRFLLKFRRWRGLIGVLVVFLVQVLRLQGGFVYFYYVYFVFCHLCCFGIQIRPLIRFVITFPARYAAFCRLTILLFCLLDWYFVVNLVVLSVEVCRFFTFRCGEFRFFIRRPFFAVIRFGDFKALVILVFYIVFYFLVYD